MKKPLAAFLSVLSVCLPGACSGADPAAVGVYELDKAAFKESVIASMPAEAKKDQGRMDMIDSMFAAMSATVELRADGTASAINKAVLGQPDTTENGTWTLVGDKLTITTKNKEGKVDSRVATLAGSAFTIDVVEGGQTVKVAFRRK